MNFKSGFRKVAIANVTSLLLSITTGFLIPSFLSINEYASLKTFMLYLSFVEILHFGFVNGIHVKYGGKEDSETNKGEVKQEHNFFLVFEVFISIIVIVIGIIVKDYILVAFAFMIIPMNMIAMFKSYYQATGEFHIYSKIILMMSLLTLLMRLFNIYIINIDSYWNFVVGLILVKYMIFAMLELKYIKENQHIKPRIQREELSNHFKIGMFILIGNLASKLVYSIDSWFVKVLFTDNDFAFYSFAISIMGTINIVIDSVTLVFYPYLSINKNKTNIINEVSIWLLIIGSFLSGIYFIFSYIIINFLEKYNASLNVIAILFLTYPVLLIIKAIYVNLYKAKKEERKYVKAMSIFLTLSIVLNILAVLIFNNIHAIAVATIIAFYIWFFFNDVGFKIACCSNKSKIYLLLYILIFVFSVYYLNWWMGFVVFYLTMFALIFLFYKKESIKMIKIFTNRVL